MKILGRRSSDSQNLQEESITNRQQSISGWRQDRISEGRVLILGAGALGNEAVKNLALMGVGYMLIADMDQVSLSNLSRAVFFRKRDVQQHRNKAEIVALRAREINVTPHAVAQVFQGDIVWQLGGGVYRRVDVVLSCLDNIEARMKANANCLFTSTPFIDGGILGLAGTVTAVYPPATACWECTTYASERDNASNRYDSCSNLMRRDLMAERLPAVQVASSIIAGFQTQEAVKIIQGQSWAAGSMIHYDASTQHPYLDVNTISRRPGCWCNLATILEDVLELPLSATANTLNDLIAILVKNGYQDLNITLPGPFVATRYCFRCNRQDPVMRPRFMLDTSILACPFCGAEGNEWIKLKLIDQTHPLQFAEIEDGWALRERMFALPLINVGFPFLALVQVKATDKDGIQELVIELSADAEQVMGGAKYATVRQHDGRMNRSNVLG